RASAPASGSTAAPAEFVSTPPKAFHKLRLYLNQLLRHKAVRFAMDTLGCLGVWCMNKTKHFACLLVEPVFGVFDAIFPLRVHVFGVSLCDIFRSGSLRKIVNVHVQRHSRETLPRYYAMQNADAGRMSKRLVND